MNETVACQMDTSIKRGGLVTLIKRCPTLLFALWAFSGSAILAWGQESLPTGPLGKPRSSGGGSLRNYVPPTLQDEGLPKTRDFQAEAEGRRGGMRVVGQTQDQAQASATNIQTAAAEGEAILATHGGYKMVKRSAKVWEFGLEITAAGPMNGVVASAPVPIEWPEQKLTVLSEFRSPTVSSVRMKPFPGQGQQMIVSVGQLGAGQTARATVTMRVERFDVVAPETPLNWQFPKKGSKTAKGYLGDSPYIETNHKRIRELADEVVRPDDSPWKQVESIYDWVQQNIEYEFDPQIHSCLEALDSKRGDCEEVASLFIALCRSRGIPARAVWCNDHTYPEFLMRTEDGTEVWLPCQITTYDRIFGQMFDDRPILQKGDKFSVMGELRPTRYLKPAMTAKSATGAPQFRWIIQEVDPKDIKSDSSPLGG